ncbi:hypothetical protein GALMADRAFT_452701 [Galerina marginata CBS 339.88]|uniref:Uncharacterized protein n=1 Tax=Galerina marginata (strain CBS 339.88) TaxID=685588 RepID=A0A067T0H5_GALM3|nr:hypothetical protein GALMADRAFT_452701 [Galerina marginata CBS 339.88]
MLEPGDADYARCPAGWQRQENPNEAAPLDDPGEGDEGLLAEGYNLQGKHDAVEEIERGAAQLEAEGARAHGNGSFDRSTSQASIRAVENFETDHLGTHTTFQSDLLTSDNPIPLKISPGDPIPTEITANLTIFLVRISLFGLKDSGQSMLERAKDGVAKDVGLERREERAGFVSRRRGKLLVVVVHFRDYSTLGISQPLIGHLTAAITWHPGPSVIARTRIRLPILAQHFPRIALEDPAFTTLPTEIYTHLRHTYFIFQATTENLTLYVFTDTWSDPTRFPDSNRHFVLTKIDANANATRKLK